MEQLQAVIMAAFAMSGLSVAIFGLRFLLGDNQQYERNRKLTRSSSAAASGNVLGSPASPQHRVARGVAIDRRKGRLTDQGRLSDEAVHNAMTRKP